MAFDPQRREAAHSVVQTVVVEQPAQHMSAQRTGNLEIEQGRRMSRFFGKHREQGPVRTEDRYRLAGADVEIDLAQDGPIRVADSSAAQRHLDGVCAALVTGLDAV